MKRRIISAASWISGTTETFENICQNSEINKSNKVDIDRDNDMLNNENNESDFNLYYNDSGNFGDFMLKIGETVLLVF
jgi:hypothetical protein